MAVNLVIDGYNLIRQSAKFRAQEELALEIGREALLEELRQYKRVVGHRITVVFDGTSRPELSEERLQQRGVRVIYSGSGKTADSVIKRLCRERGRGLLLVTSDRELASYAENCGAVALKSEDFEEKMEMARYLDFKGSEEEDEVEGWPGRQGARKKGPARRLSKKQRRRRQRLGKL